ncbi:uncharacterized protein TNCV_4151511 [Trichonephila clavipes]|nr:uncharacterized protein TNCV_4151511 [Trichonephila clavipes]
MWSMVAQRLTQITPPAATPNQLWQRVEAAWSAVPQEHTSKVSLNQCRGVWQRPEGILSVDELNIDQAPQDINKEEFQLEHVRLQSFVAATDPGCKKELIRSASLGLLKYIIESKLEDGLPSIVMIIIFLTSAISNASCERSFSKLKLIKNSQVDYVHVKANKFSYSGY